MLKGEVNKKTLDASARLTADVGSLPLITGLSTTYSTVNYNSY
jgi:hypothetical protein